jgi:hypothetical protein
MNVETKATKERIDRLEPVFMGYPYIPIVRNRKASRNAPERKRQGQSADENGT